jgi:PHP family Zn ribbon phosphoesterase
VEQKNLLGQQNSALIANHGLQPSDHKKQITACCFAALQFESTASIFKEDLRTSIT